MPVPDGWRKTWELMRAAKSKRMAGAGEKLMLMMLVDYCNDAGQCWETQESLALDCCMSVRAAGEHIRSLVDVGAIESMQRRRSGLPAIVTLDIIRIMSDDPHEFRPAKSADQDRQNLPIKTGKICTSEGSRPAESADQDRQNLPIHIDTPNKPPNKQEVGRTQAHTIPLPQRLCLQLSAALKISAQPTTAVSSTHPGMLALVKAIPPEWEDTALAMVVDVVRELVGNGKSGPGLYAYTLAVLKTRMEREVAKSQAASPGHVNGGCPHDQIVALWGEALPGCRQPIKWGGERARNLADRWGEDVDRQSLDWWEKFFRYLGESDFLMGRTRHRFSMGLDWIVKEDIFLKALEGGYENGDDNA